MVFLVLAWTPSACESTFEPSAAVGAEEPLGPEGDGGPAVTDSVVQGDGTLYLLPVQGGCWALDAPIGRFHPLELPAEVREDGMKVRFMGTIRSGVGGFCAVGPALELEWIHAVEGP